jgi:hypothetical protein
LNGPSRLPAAKISPISGDDARHPPAVQVRGGPGPTYDRSDALTYVGARYDRGLRLVGLSVRGLMADEDRRALLLRWHEEGLRDWEIPSIVLNAGSQSSI